VLQKAEIRAHHVSDSLMPIPHQEIRNPENKQGRHGQGHSGNAGLTVTFSSIIGSAAHVECCSFRNASSGADAE
jgi:hypothetical protein